MRTAVPRAAIATSASRIRIEGPGVRLAARASTGVAPDPGRRNRGSMNLAKLGSATARVTSWVGDASMRSGPASGSTTLGRATVPGPAITGL